MKKICDWCAVTFETRKHGRKARFCSRFCQTQALYYGRRAAESER